MYVCVCVCIDKTLVRKKVTSKFQITLQHKHIENIPKPHHHTHTEEKNCYTHTHTTTKHNNYQRGVKQTKVNTL